MDEPERDNRSPDSFPLQLRHSAGLFNGDNTANAALSANKPPGFPQVGITNSVWAVPPDNLK